MSGRVLALRALGLGDALTGIPALRGLRRAYPDRRLVLAAPTHIGAWLTSLGVVDEVWVTPDLDVLSAAGWSTRYGSPPAVAVDLHGCGPLSQQLLWPFRAGRLVSFHCQRSGQHDGPDWDDDEHEVDRWCRLVRSVGGECGRADLRLDRRSERAPVAVVHPGAASASRCWPWRRWARVAGTLRAAGWQVVVTGDHSERELCARVCADAPGSRDLAGLLGLPGLAELVAHAGLVLCGDTGVGHLATAYATPSVLLFGPTPPWRWGPAIDPDRHRVLWHGPSLSANGPWVGDPHGTSIDPALALVSVDEVLGTAAELLGGRLGARLPTDRPLPGTPPVR